MAVRSDGLVERIADDYLPEQRRTELIGVGLVLAVATALRGFQLGRESLFLDEIYSVTVRTDLTILGQLATKDPHPPLFYVLLDAWTTVFGNSPVAARSLSVLFGVGGVFMVYLLARELFDVRAGLAAALFLALSPQHIQQSQTVRMYSLHVLLVVASFYLLVRSLERDRSAGVVLGYIVTTALMCYTHVFALFYLIAQNCYVLTVHWRRSSEPTPRQWIEIQGAIGVLFAPWLVQLVPQVVSVAFGASGAGPDVSWISLPTPATVLDVFQAFSGYLIGYPFNVYGSANAEVSLLTLGVLSALVALSLVGSRDGTWFLRGQRLRSEYLLGLWLVIPVALPYAISYLVAPLFDVRFLIAVGVALFVLAAGGISRLRRAPLQVLVVLLVVSALSLSAGTYYRSDTSENWKGADAYLDAQVNADQVILTTLTFTEPITYYSDRPDLDIERYPEDVTLAGNTSKTSESSESASSARNASVEHAIDESANGRVWVVLSREDENGERLLNALNESASLVRMRSFGVVRVYTYDATVDSTNRYTLTAYRR